MATATISVDISALKGLDKEIESILGELEPHTRERVVERAQLLIGSGNLLTTDQYSDPANTSEIRIVARPTDSFNRFLSALRAREFEGLIAEIE